MPTYFPQINAQGVMVQRPFATTHAFLTSAAESPSGRRYGYSWRDEPLGRWDLQYPAITEAEFATLETFFSQMEGRLGEFAFLDPGANLIRYSEDFSGATWERYDASQGGTGADPFGGSRARAVSSGGSNGMLASVVLPEGDAAGFVLCGSVWVRSPWASTLSIGFIDSGFSVLGNRLWDLPAGAWTRIHHGMAIGTNSPIRLLIGGFATWASSLELFGAQVAPLPGPGGYQKTPGNYGLRSKCRFDVDRLEARYVAPGQVSVRLKIAEFK